jgi:hypothetical protein
MVPAPVTVEVKVDYGNLLRLHAEMTYHLVEQIKRPSLGAGVAFPLYGNDAARTGGFQLKIPLIAEMGVLFGNNEPGYGNGSEKVRLRWFIFGPSTGLDFTWWAPEKAGFWFSLNAGYMFYIDLGSGYDDGSPPFGSPAVGVFESSLLLGAAF